MGEDVLAIQIKVDKSWVYIFPHCNSNDFSVSSSLINASVLTRATVSGRWLYSPICQ